MSCLVGVAFALVLMSCFLSSRASADLTYLPHKLAVETNEKYGSNCFWAPPKGVERG